MILVCGRAAALPTIGLTIMLIVFSSQEHRDDGPGLPRVLGIQSRGAKATARLPSLRGIGQISLTNIFGPL